MFGNKVLFSFIYGAFALKANEKNCLVKIQKQLKAESPELILGF
jgi:hypothetical protein